MVETVWAGKQNIVIFMNGDMNNPNKLKSDTPLKIQRERDHFYGYT